MDTFNKETTKTDKSVLICTKRREIQIAYRTPKEFEPGYEWYVFGTLGFSLTYQDSEVAAWRCLPRVYCGKENSI